MRMTDEFKKAIPDDDHIQRQVSADEAHCNSDRFLKAAQKDQTEHGDQSDRDAELMFQHLRRKRVFYDVRRGIGSGKRDSDDEVSSDETEQHEDKEFALPARQQMLEHRDGALAVRTFFSDFVVDGQGAEKRQQHED